MHVAIGTPAPFGFSAESVIAVGGGPFDVVAADFTGDGRLDLAVSRSNLSDIVVLRNEADGTFIQLQKKEREKVQQNAEMAFPAEFRELIKQYNINIKNLLKPQGAPAAASKSEEKK